MIGAPVAADNWMSETRLTVIAAAEQDAALTAARGNGTFYKWDAGLLTRYWPTPMECPALAIWPSKPDLGPISDVDATAESYDLAFQIVSEAQDVSIAENILAKLKAALEAAWSVICQCRDGQLAQILPQDVTFGFFESAQKDARPLWSVSGVLHCDYELDPVEE